MKKVGNPKHVSDVVTKVLWMTLIEIYVLEFLKKKLYYMKKVRGLICESSHLQAYTHVINV